MKTSLPAVGLLSLFALASCTSNSGSLASSGEERRIIMPSQRGKVLHSKSPAITAAPAASTISEASSTASQASEADAKPAKKRGGFFAFLGFGSSDDNNVEPEIQIETKAAALDANSGLSPVSTPLLNSQPATAINPLEGATTQQPSAAQAAAAATIISGELPPSTEALSPMSNSLRGPNNDTPEEHSSRQDGSAPRPNSIELRGLRSPSLPKNLPMKF